LNQNFAKWKICEVIAVGLNSASWGYVESICSGGVLGLLSRTQDEVCDFFEKLAWGTYAFEWARNNFGYPTHGEYVFHANPYPQDHFMSSYDPFHSYAPPMLCDYCESSDRDGCNYTYHAYVDAKCVSVEKTIKDMTDKMVDKMKDRVAEYSRCLLKVGRILI